MNLAVLGASGRTGRHLVEQALADGHTVAALVRDPAKLPLKHDRLRLVVGDALDAERIDELVRGRDAVLNALGPVKGGPDDLLARSTRLLADAMTRHGVRRVVVEGGAGMRVPEDHPGLGGRIVGGLVARLIPKQVADKRAQMEILRDAGLDFVIVRAPVLTDGPLTRTYRLGFPDMGPGAKIGRADIAHAMLAQTRRDEWLGRAPAIRY